MKSALLALILTAGLHASSITITSTDNSRGGNVKFRADGTEVTDFAGVINATYNGGPSMPFFCIDLFTPIGYETYTSTVYLPNTARHEDRAVWLYVNRLSTVTTAALGEAFQLAIWDIVHDNGDGPTAGRVRSSSNTPSGVVTSWNTYLSASSGQSLMTGASIYVNFTGTTPKQTLIGGFQPGGLVTIPEPSAYALLGAGLIGLACLKRRQR